MSIKINVLLGFSFQLATQIKIGVLIQAVIFWLLIKLKLPKKYWPNRKEFIKRYVFDVHSGEFNEILFYAGIGCDLLSEIMFWFFCDVHSPEQSAFLFLGLGIFFQILAFGLINICAISISLTYRTDRKIELMQERSNDLYQFQEKSTSKNLF